MDNLASVHHYHHHYHHRDPTCEYRMSHRHRIVSCTQTPRTTPMAGGPVSRTAPHQLFSAHYYVLDLLFLMHPHIWLLTFCCHHYSHSCCYQDHCCHHHHHCCCRHCCCFYHGQPRSMARLCPSSHHPLAATNPSFHSCQNSGAPPDYQQ